MAVTRGALNYAIGIAAVAGLVVWASIPVVVARHFRELAKAPPTDWANARVISIEPHGDDFIAVVEFSPRQDVTVRATLPVDAIGIGPMRRPAWEVGREVTVAFDPKNPTNAHLGGIGDLWSAIMWRAFLGYVSLFFAAILYFSKKWRRVPLLPGSRRE